MHIDADAFFASVEQGFNPLLTRKPVIVGGTAEQRGVVHTASYEARAKGIKTGMSLIRAKEKCSNAVFLKGNFQHYQAASETMQSIYLQYTPKVEFTSLDDAYLDLTGTLHLHPPLKELAKQIQQQIWEALGFTVSIGISSNKLISRIASGYKKPSGITIIPRQLELEFLSPLSANHLPGIGHVAHEKLIELGIFTIDDLQKLPLLILTQLFGANGQRFWEMSRGMDKRIVNTHILPSQVSRETTFEEDQNDGDTILATLQYLTERVAQTLFRQKLTAKQVGIKIRYSDFGQKQMQKTIPNPTNSASELFVRIRMMFNKIYTRRVRIRHVGVQAGSLLWQQKQLSLFNESQKLESLNTTVENIRERFGFMSLLPAESLLLKKKYRIDKSGFILHSPALTK